MSKAAFHRRLHRWYAEHGRRDLPWRNTADAYAIHVSEVMLQQTQVATVRDRYYHSFLKQFPTFAALAAAPQEQVLAAWQGLGYYNRAINLHKAAKEMAGDQDSGFGIQKKKSPYCPDPESRSLISSLMALPGVGRNTAHAIAAFAYRQPMAVMEANVKRVLSRIFALKNPAENKLWEKAAALLDKKEPFDYNQAMMDLGAMVCTVRTPCCTECPAEIICQGKASPQSYPAAKKKKAPPVRKKIITILRNNTGHYYATPRRTRFLQGLYHFVENDAPARGRIIGHVRQQYSHFTLEGEIRLANAGERNGKDWYSMQALQRLPMSAAEKKILELLCSAAT